MKAPHFLANVDASWTLFLDRDGVINHKIEEDYVKHIGEFEFLPGVLEALYDFTFIFNKIIVVTNQQGIAKGIMSEEQLNKVHDYISYEVDKINGRIDAFYFCPHFSAECSFCRKPNIGMALLAKADFPEIDFSKSIMIGDSNSDMEFGKKAGMYTVKISSKIDNNNIEKIDIFASSLVSFSKLLNKYLHT